MSKEKISSQEIIDLVASKLSVSKRVAEDFLKVMFATIEDALVEGESVKIKNFGTFKLQWNEPRKSVNVQTGDEIILDGYHKVTFTPDSNLKDVVNEPFAHLEPIELDAKNEPVKESVSQDEAFDPLRIFNEQASEIKDILSEINALSNSNSAVNQQAKEETSVEEVTEIVLDYLPDVEDDNVDEMQSEAMEEPKVPEEVLIVPEPQSVEEVNVVEKNQPEEEVKAPEIIVQKVEEVSVVIETQTVEPKPKEELLNQIADPFTSQPKKKRSWKWLWITVLVIFLLKIGFVVNYYLSSATRCWIKYSYLSDENRQKLDVIDEKVYSFFSKVDGLISTDEKAVAIAEIDTVPAVDDIAPVDSVPVTVAQPAIDSLEILLNQPRVYTEFLGSERIREGSMLTHFAKRYYGKKEFWVYIYEANKDHLSHPDRIPMGTLIRVPKVDKRLIDANNPRCIDKAKELHDLYVGVK